MDCFSLRACLRASDLARKHHVTAELDTGQEGQAGARFDGPIS